jgi:hypothetical protein
MGKSETETAKEHNKQDEYSSKLVGKSVVSQIQDFPAVRFGNSPAILLRYEVVAACCVRDACATLVSTLVFQFCLEPASRT